ncbi:Protein of unknown function DUF227 [Trinorchestia longiramus]|nr:Protein of unknown function DUF227 [Trinorchestia longiramus]
MSSEDSPAPISPRDYAVQVLTPTVLQEVLLKDVGSGAKFKSFEIKDFCSKGDNFACYVTSVAVKYILGSKEKCASYVVKLNQFNQLETFETFTVKVFEKEGRFHSELIPALNQLRKTIHLPPLKYPSCFYASFKAGNELLLLEDMREKSFRMSAVKHDLDNDHVLLVMEELAHLHASSVVLEEQMGTENFLTTFNFLEEVFTSKLIPPMLQENITDFVRNGIRAAEKIGGYEELAARLLEVDPSIFECVDTAKKTCNPKFRVANHGDCWTNNMLFRYDSEKVAEVCLLDLQLNRFGPLGLDLNQFLFTSVSSDSRKNSIMNFLSTYYNSFKKVFDLVKKPMKFTFEELYEEYRQKNTYGVLMDFLSIAMLGLKTEDMPDYVDLKEDEAKSEANKNEMKLMTALDVNPILRSRLTNLLEEIETNRIY